MRALGNKLLLGVLLMQLATLCNAQNSQFSQFYSSPTNLGPSFAGITKNSRVVMNFRDQWPAVPGVFQTYAVSFDHYLPKLNSGVGFLVYRDQAGAGNLAATKFGVQYAYNVKLNRHWSFRPGIMFAYEQTSIDLGKLVFINGLTIDGTTSGPTAAPSTVLPKTGYIDFSSSVLLVNSRAWVGATADHLLRPDRSLRKEVESKIPIKFSLYGGYKFQVSNNRRKRLKENVIVSFLYKAQSNYDQIDVGAYWHKNPLTLGLWLRGISGFMSSMEGYGNLDALVVLLGYQIRNLKLGYSYDFTISDLIGTTGGAHEISLIYEFKSNLSIKSRRRRDPIPCPTF